MRMLEWQTESSLFTVRIRGRQWYWVYKIELKDLLKATQTSKNIGHDYWESYANTNGDLIAKKLNEIQLKNHNKEYLNVYKKKIKAMGNKQKNYQTSIYDSKFDNQLTHKASDSLYKEDYLDLKPKILTKNLENAIPKAQIFRSLESDAAKLSIISKSNNKSNPTVLTHDATNDNKRYMRTHSYNMLNYVSLNNTKQLNWTENVNVVSSKTTADNMYFVIKQKRFAPPIKKISTVNTKSLINSVVLKNYSSLQTVKDHNYTTKWTAKRLKYKSATIPLTYNRRLLRTRRVLVLPSQINITLITNSFDVVHSWYIPGLGIKLDCIPGRSTHHTIFIDHAGFYYGQCAEICGRYHHHMPIRVCALPFEHFLIWWYHYGLPYFNATSTSRQASIKTGIKQYNW